MAPLKRVIVIGVASSTVLLVAVFIFVTLPIFGNSLQPFDGMAEMMQGGMMEMQAPEDVMILFESDSDVPAGKETQIVLKVIDKQTNATMRGANVLIGIEKGLPMTTMDMMKGGMFSAEDKDNGEYAFSFMPESEGYYTIHAHIIPPGEQTNSMMKNHVDFVVISQIPSWE